MSEKSGDCHKGIRSYKSGHEKRQRKKIKLHHEQAVLSQTRSMTDFLVPKKQLDSQTNSSNSTPSSPELVESAGRNLVSSLLITIFTWSLLKNVPLNEPCA